MREFAFAQGKTILSSSFAHRGGVRYRHGGRVYVFSSYELDGRILDDGDYSYLGWTLQLIVSRGREFKNTCVTVIWMWG